MPRFEGPQPGFKDDRTHTKGVMRRYRLQKRKEAEERQRLCHIRTQQETVTSAEEPTK